MPEDLELLSPTEGGRRSKMRPAMAAIFVAATAGIVVVTLQLPHLLSHKAPALALLWAALVMFCLALIAGGVFLWFISDRFARTASEFRRVRSIVRSATGADTQGSAMLSPGKQWPLVALLAALPVIALSIFFVTHRLFPNAPTWTPVATIWVAGAILVVLTWLKKGRSPQSRLRRPALWRTLLAATLWFALLVVATRFDPRWLAPYIDPKTFLIVLPLLCLALPFIVWGFGFLPPWWIGRALARADYDTALRRSDFLLRVSPNDGGFQFFRGTVLLFAGRYPEAEHALSESAEAGDVAATYSQSATLANLGEAVMLQGRYQEAIRMYEAAVRIHPGWGRAYSGMAEAYLWRDIEPERALEFIDRALERKLRSRASRRFDRHVLAQMYADRAWALALLGRAGESRGSLEQAFRAASRRFRPGLASVHYRAGRSLLALKGGREAEEHFRIARELDPGSSGIQAAAMLRRGM